MLHTSLKCKKYFSMHAGGVISFNQTKFKFQYVMYYNRDCTFKSRNDNILLFIEGKNIFIEFFDSVYR